MTWHRGHGQFVVSQWRHGVCIGATRIGVAEAGELLAVLAEGITDAATAGPAEAAVSAVWAPAEDLDRPEPEA